MPRKKIIKKNPAKIEEKSKKSFIPHILPAVLLIAILAIVFYSRSFFYAASVNGEPISKSSLIDALKQQSGRDTLEGLIAERLIMQEAKNRKIEVTQDEINQEVKKIEKNVAAQGQKLDQILVMQGLSKEKFQEQIKIQKVLEKMLAKDIVVSDQEIDEFIKTNEQFLTEGANPEDVKKNVREQLRQSKLREKTRGFIDELKKKSEVNYFINLK